MFLSHHTCVCVRSVHLCVSLTDHWLMCSCGVWVCLKCWSMCLAHKGWAELSVRPPICEHQDCHLIFIQRVISEAINNNENSRYIVIYLRDQRNSFMSFLKNPFGKNKNRQVWDNWHWHCCDVCLIVLLYSHWADIKNTFLLKVWCHRKSVTCLCWLYPYHKVSLSIIIHLIKHQWWKYDLV